MKVGTATYGTVCTTVTCAPTPRIQQSLCAKGTVSDTQRSFRRGKGQTNPNHIDSGMGQRQKTSSKRDEPQKQYLARCLGILIKTPLTLDFWLHSGTLSWPQLHAILTAASLHCGLRRRHLCIRRPALAVLGPSVWVGGSCSAHQWLQAPAARAALPGKSL